MLPSVLLRKQLPTFSNPLHMCVAWHAYTPFCCREVASPVSIVSTHCSFRQEDSFPAGNLNFSLNAQGRRVGEERGKEQVSCLATYGYCPFDKCQPLKNDSGLDEQRTFLFLPFTLFSNYSKKHEFFYSWKTSSTFGRTACKNHPSRSLFC